MKSQTSNQYHSRQSENELRPQPLPASSNPTTRTPLSFQPHSECQCSLADLVRELLDPMLRDWLDQYLPNIVERCVNAEIERLVKS